MSLQISDRLWQWNITNWRFQEWLNNTLGNNTIECKKLSTIVSGRKNVARPFFSRKQVSTNAKMYVAVIFWHSYLPVFVFFDLKQLLRVSCILWCYYPKCYSITLENTSLWCFIVICICECPCIFHFNIQSIWLKHLRPLLNRKS